MRDAAAGENGEANASSSSPDHDAAAEGVPARMRPAIPSCWTVGFVAAAAVVASIVAAPGARGVLGAGLALIMLAIAVVDARQFIVPNELNAAGLVLALVHAAFAQPDAGVFEAIAMALLRGAALALMFFALREAYRRLRKREGIGLGDVKLAGVAGAWLDWPTMPVAVEIAALSALAVYALRHFVFGRRVQATSRIAFALFFAPAIWLAWLIEVMLLRY
jgi:leader peptidase (prepilin peptidase) / N-methyltransferase